ELWLADVQRRIDVHDARQRFHAIDELTADLFQPLQVRSIDDELDVRVLCTAAPDVCDLLHGGAQGLREGRQDLVAEQGHDLELFPLPLLDRLQPHVDVGQVARATGIAGNRDQRV